MEAYKILLVVVGGRPPPRQQLGGVSSPSEMASLGTLPDRVNDRL